MFDNDDVNHMMSSNSRIPDGVIDGSQYAEIFQNLNSIIEAAEPGDYQSNILWVMKCINECYSDKEDGTGSEFDQKRAADVVTSLAYFTMTMAAVLDEVGVKDQYFDHQREVVIPELMKDCKTIPWYDFADEVKNLAHLDSSLDEFLKNNEGTDD